MPFYRTFPKRVPEKFPSAVLVERMLRYQLPVGKLMQGVFPLRRSEHNLEHNRRGAYSRIEAVLSNETYQMKGSEVVIGEQGAFSSDLQCKFERMLTLDAVAYQASDPTLLNDLYQEMADYHRKNKRRKYGRGVLQVSGEHMKLERITHELVRFSRKKRIPFYRGAG